MALRIEPARRAPPLPVDWRQRRDDALLDAVLSFLQVRAPALARMVCARLGLPDLDVG